MEQHKGMDVKCTEQGRRTVKMELKVDYCGLKCSMVQDGRAVSEDRSFQQDSWRVEMCEGFDFVSALNAK